MNFEDFARLTESQKLRNPFWFASKADRVPTDAEIKEAEKTLNLSLPQEYISFVKAYGGGEFAFVNIFSLDLRSDWSVVARNESVKRHDFLAVSDDQSGGFYGFRVVNGKCESKVVYFDFETNEILGQPVFEDLYEYVARVGLRSA